MADPRRFTIRKPQKAGQMGAQNPDSSGRKGTLLTGSLQTSKDEANKGVHRIFFPDSPYTVLDTDEIIEAGASAGEVVIRLPYAPEHLGRRLTIVKTDGSANNVQVDSGDVIHIPGVNTRAIYLKTQDAVAVVQALALDPATTRNRWRVMSLIGTVDGIP